MISLQDILTWMITIATCVGVAYIFYLGIKNALDKKKPNTEEPKTPEREPKW